ncbi:MAG: type II secretion system minor pseudopilin GspK [Nitrospirota bacterium]
MTGTNHNTRHERLKRFKRLHCDNKGSALIVTLLLVTVLTGLVVDFVYEVYIDSSSLSNWSNAQRASLIAKSGQVIAAEFIKEIKKEDYTDKREIMLPVDQDFGPGAGLVITIEDENSKFNLNSIILEDGLHQDDVKLESLKKLLEYLNINPNLALTIADWIDFDSEPRLHNSENFAKNDFLWSVDELRLVNGVDKEIFEKISPYVRVSVYSDYMVNINTAEIPVLMSLKDMTERLAKNIVDHRGSYPFEKNEDLNNVSDIDSIYIGLQGKYTVKASSFRTTTSATVNEITRVIESVTDSNSKINFWREG